MQRSVLISRLGVAASAVALVATSATFAAAGSAPGAAVKSWTSCTNKGCQGLGADPTGCSKDARNIRSTAIADSNGKVIGWVDLRWSPTCGNNWARVRSTGIATLTATAIRSDGKTMSATGLSQTVASAMVFGRDLCVAASGSINGITAKTPCA
jgi:Protein of unknown function (DUF2690)